jgi:hypothetical protein
MPYYTGKCRRCGHEMPMVVSEYLSTGETIDISDPCPECGASDWYKPRMELVADERENWKFQAHGNDLTDPRLAEVLSEEPIRHKRKRLYFHG